MTGNEKAYVIVYGPGKVSGFVFEGRAVAEIALERVRDQLTHPEDALEALIRTQN
jgi:hypothetical protein